MAERCTWCEHTAHDSGCGQLIIVAVCPSGERKTTTKIVPCPCARSRRG